MLDQTLTGVREFWEENPLFEGESSFVSGTREFFDEHDRVYERDCFAGAVDPRVIPDESHRGRVLDLGCGPGFWVVQLAKAGARNLVAADLTRSALALTAERARLHCVRVALTEQNAEDTGFRSNSFDHVNCQGVIHHTPRPDACVREIARILRPEGTAVISVYYRNVILRQWGWLRPLAFVLARFGGRLKGRGREKILELKDVDDLVRLYDGSRNPIGKAFSKEGFRELLGPAFVVDEMFLHYFPTRALPFPVPAILHKALDRAAGFMIYAVCRKVGTDD